MQRGNTGDKVHKKVGDRYWVEMEFYGKGVLYIDSWQGKYCFYRKYY